MKRLLLRSAVSALALALVFYNVDFAELWAQLRTLDPGVLPGIAVAALGWWLLRIGRLRTMLPTGGGKIPWGDGFRALGVGGLGNLILPLRSGDVLRCVVLDRLTPGLGLPATFGVLVLEKALDFAAVLLVVLAWAAAVATPDWVGALVTSALAAGLALLAAAVTVRWLERALAVRAACRPEGWIARRLAPLVGRLRDGWSVVSSGRRLALTLAQTVAIRAVESAVLFGFLRALDLPLGFLEAAVVTSFVVLSMAVPAAPGFLGTYELAAVLSLGLFGVGEEDAVAFALLSHAWQFAVGIGVGLMAVATLPVAFRSEIFGRSAAAEPAERSAR